MCSFLVLGLPFGEPATIQGRSSYGSGASNYVSNSGGGYGGGGYGGGGYGGGGYGGRYSGPVYQGSGGLPGSGSVSVWDYLGMASMSKFYRY